jgi:predicted flap endonuclease-1-like 5' DNA nuclease
MYLLTQWWLYLLLAALIGFLAGYFWGKCRCKTEEIEAERDAALAEVARLKAAPAPAAVAAAPAVDTEELDRLKWRNRYLEARTSFLEAAPAAAAGAVGLAAVGAAAVAAAPKEEKPASKKAEPAPKPAAPKEPDNASFTPSAVAAMDSAALESAVIAAGDGAKPVGLSAPQGGKPDDLKEIGGIGPKNEAWLHAQGLYHFWQIATLEIPAVAWLAKNLPTFGSRVYRENWVDQAVKLARGELTDAKAKYQQGKHT